MIIIKYLSIYLSIYLDKRKVEFFFHPIYVYARDKNAVKALPTRRKVSYLTHNSVLHRFYRGQISPQGRLDTWKALAGVARLLPRRWLCLEVE